MPIVDLDAVLPDSEFDLVYDHIPSGLDAQHLGSFHDVVSAGLAVVDAGGAHDLGQPVALDGQVVALFGTVLFGDDGTLDSRITLDDHVRQAALQRLHHEVQLVLTRIVRLDMDLVVAHLFHMPLLDLELASLENALNDRVSGDLKLKSIYSLQVYLQREITALWTIHFFDVFRNITQLCLLDPTFDYSSGHDTRLIL